MWERYQVSSAARGYGPAHRKRRKALLPFAYGKPCALCGEIMLAEQSLQLDHSVPVALGGTIGDRIVHGKCNLRTGAKLGNDMQRKSRKFDGFQPSREW